MSSSSWSSTSSSSGLHASVMMRVMKELRSLHESPMDGISVLVGDESVSVITADMDGPAGTPFEAGRFRLRLLLPPDFPQSPPKAVFLTKIFHPNVSASGEICVNTLKRDWKASHGLRHVLLVVRCLLIQPNPESALNEEAGRLLMEAYDEYEKRARLMTRVHAPTIARTAAAAPAAAATAGASTPAVGPASASAELKKDVSSSSSRAGGGEMGEDDVCGQENAHVNSPRQGGNAQSAVSVPQAAGESKRVGSDQTELEGGDGARSSKRLMTAAATVKPPHDTKPDKPKVAIKKSIKRL